jgi:hypothetical protein
VKRHLTLIAAVALLAASCGTGAAPGEPLARAAENVRAAETASISFSSTMALPQEAGGGELTASGEGAIDYGENRGRLTMSFEGTGPASEMAEMMGEIESLYDGTVVYMRWPMMAQMLPEQTEWLKMDLAEIGEEMGIDFGQLMQMGQNDPFQGVEFLRGAEDVEEVGTEDIDGVQTTHYTATIDFERLAEELEGDQGEIVRNMIAETDIDDISADVWIDGDELIRRVRYEFDAPPVPAETETTEDGGFSMQMDFFDYGTAVDIELPADEDVTDLGELIRQQG